MPRLLLSLLGPFDVSLGGLGGIDFGYDHVRALLAYLAVEAPLPHRREALAGLLWPEQSGHVGLKNLRNALYRLQRVIGNQQASPPFLLVARDAVQFNTSSDYELDVSHFQELVSTGDAGNRQSRLEQAVQIYRGPFLQGFSLGSSYPFEEWLLAKREQLDRLMGTALQELAEASEARGEHERAEGYARRFLALDPWNEAAHRQLMRVLALQGQRGAALAQYRALGKELHAEFDAEPEPETVALYARIRGGELSLASGQTRLTTAQRNSPPLPFVGRDREQQQLSHCLDEALAGRGQVAFVIGEAGSGKTALMAEFAQQAIALHPQLVVASGTCTAQGGVGDPYLPFREILQSLLGDVTAPLSNGTLPHFYADHQWAIAPIVIQALVEDGPDLVHRLVAGGPLGLRAESLARQMPPGPRGPPWLSRLQELVGHPPALGQAEAPITPTDLLSQYTRVLQRAAQARPLLLLLDDLQWADAGTIGLLFHLSRHLGGQPILMLGAYRADEVAIGHDGKRHPLQPVVNELRRSGHECVVDLQQAEGRSFVDALLDREPNCLGAAFRETLYRHTGGHALFTVELLRGMRERGELQRDGDGRWIEGPGLNWKALPPRVEAAIAERLAQLQETQRAILRVASVEGEAFSAEVIARVRGMEEEQVLGCLSRELGSGLRLIHAEGLTGQGSQSMSRYRFRHQLFQEYIYRSLDAVERARLHRAVLAALEAIRGDQADTLAGALARHAEAADLADRAAQYWFQAGQRAFVLSAYDEAVALFQRSLTWVDKLPQSPERDKRELEAQLALASPLFVAKGWGASERDNAVRRAHDLALRLGDVEHRLPLLASLSSLALGHLKFGEALDYSEQLVSLAQASGSALYAASGHHVLGLTLLTMGRLLESRLHLEQALTSYPWEANRSLAMSLGLGTDVQVNLYLWLSHNVWLLGYPEQAREYIVQAMRLAEQLGHPPTLAVALVVRCDAAAFMRNEDGNVLADSERLLQLESEHGLPFVRPWGIIYHSWAQAVTAHNAAAISDLIAGLEALEQTGTLFSAPLMQSLLSSACLAVRQADTGLAGADAALSQIEQTGAAVHKSELLRLKGELLLMTGQSERDDAAAACFTEAIKVARQQGARMLELRAAVSLARLRQRQGGPAETYRDLAELYDWFTEGRESADLREARSFLEQMTYVPLPKGD